MRKRQLNKAMRAMMRDLSAGEIVEQIRFLRRAAHSTRQAALYNLPYGSRVDGPLEPHEALYLARRLREQIIFQPEKR